MVAEEFSSDSRPTVGIAVDGRTLVIAPSREGGPDIIRVTLSPRPGNPGGDVFVLEKLDPVGGVLRSTEVGIPCANVRRVVEDLASWIDTFDPRAVADVGAATALM
ncbi:hypothetical protein KCH_25200 [Kitasatospora cheerisanensis KCTC 2395]|uniref:Uncharacterized protein n=2 Tax=Kitasatospora cheerisanensis TaxID=81942 RepID=A0A066YWX3_9ACTN|nr:hypothetical protein KCH_25200 [Kitasatospora cheerisanensis KCTC 2395]